MGRIEHAVIPDQGDKSTGHQDAPAFGARLRNAQVEHPDREADGGVDDEHRAQRIDHLQPGMACQPVGHRGRQRAYRAGDRTDEAVAGKDGGSRFGGRGGSLRSEG